MSRRRLEMVALGVWCLVGFAPAWAENARTVLTEQQLAARIDAHIAAQWKLKQVTPAAPADDAEFLRRVHLDLAGRIPTVNEVRRFLDDRSTDKRRVEVDRLLEGAAYANNAAAIWRALILPNNNNVQLQFLAPQLEAWLKRHFRANTSFDKMVRELVSAPLGGNRDPRLVAVRGLGNPAEPSPLAFYQANENKPENLAASTSRLFLGVKLECAQCHDHPFAKWSRNQFWELAAFFTDIAQPTREGGFRPADFTRPTGRSIKIAGTEKEVQARFLDGKEPKWEAGNNSRTMLANWLTSTENPFFARAIANRTWAHFFGIGLIEPVDEPGDDNPPSHPELLDELGRQFAAHGFDVKYLIRAITASKTYQLASAAADPSQDQARTFAHMALKGLTPEQLYDSLAQAVGFVEVSPVGGRTAVDILGARNPTRAEFLAKFANYSDKRTEYQTSILQALSLMNGRFMAEATSVERSRTLAGVLEMPFWDDTQRLEALYLAALSRKPRADETERMLKYVASNNPSQNRQRALADVFWALLNSSEFLFNH